MKKLTIAIMILWSLGSCRDTDEPDSITIRGKVLRHHTEEVVPGVEVRAFTSGGPLHGEKTHGVSVSDRSGEYQIQLKRDPNESLSLGVDHSPNYVAYIFKDEKGIEVDPFFANYPTKDLRLDVSLYCSAYLGLRFEDQVLYDFDRIEFVHRSKTYKSSRAFLHEMHPVLTTIGHIDDSIKFTYFDSYIDSKGSVIDSVLFDQSRAFNVPGCDSLFLTINY